MDTIIPPRAYCDSSVFAAEQRRLFGRCWQFVGFRRDLAAHHDFVVRQIGGVSVVVQNFDGRIKAFTNVCSHRFNRIQTECRGNRPLQCAYHGWLYNHAGVPVGIPKKPRFDGLTPERLSALALAPWQVETCGELVFVRRAGEGPDLRTFLGDAFDLLATMTAACGPMIDENAMVIRANWKVLVENTLESYHVGFVHPTTFHRLHTQEGRFSWQAPHSRWETPLGADVAARLDKLLRVFASRPFQTDGYCHQLIFPNLTVATTKGTSFSVQLFDPVDAGTTRFTSYVFQSRLDDGAQASAAAVEALNASVRDFNRSVFAEDKEICEQVQIGAAVTDQPGVLSDEELRVMDFQRHYTAWMEEAR